MRHALVIMLMLSGLHVALQAQYSGTARVSKGVATTIESSIYTCDKGRRAGIGRSTSSDGADFTVPAATAWFDATMPWASDLHNACVGHTYATYKQALAALNGTDIVTVDPQGELLTMFIFVDNYADVYVNGVPVGKDRVPFTQFNSSIIRVRVERPFTLAIRAVDWEESLGIGVELNGGDAFHPGDGGLVVVITDSLDRIIATSDATWRAQTFYTAPIVDLSCPEEQGSERRSSRCATSNIGSYSDIYALHWPVPVDWSRESFDDTDWPYASVYSTAEVGVMNKPAYTNFLDVFERMPRAASFVWSTHLILDNEVLFRARIDAPTSVDRADAGGTLRITYDNTTKVVRVERDEEAGTQGLYRVAVYDQMGRLLRQSESEVSIHDLPYGMYVVQGICGDTTIAACILR